MTRLSWVKIDVYLKVISLWLHLCYRVNYKINFCHYVHATKYKLQCDAQKAESEF